MYNCSDQKNINHATNCNCKNNNSSNNSNTNNSNSNSNQTNDSSTDNYENSTDDLTDNHNNSNTQPIDSDNVYSQLLPNLGNNINSSPSNNLTNSNSSHVKFSSKSKAISKTIAWNNNTEDETIINNSKQKISKITANKKSITFSRSEKSFNVKTLHINCIYLLKLSELHMIQGTSAKYFKFLCDNDVDSDAENNDVDMIDEDTVIFIFVFNKSIANVEYLINNALLYLKVHMPAAQYDSWCEYLNNHEEFGDIFHSNWHDTAEYPINSIHNKDAEQLYAKQQEQWFKAKKGWGRDRKKVSSEITDIHTDIDDNGNLNGELQCLDCLKTLSWDEYHCLCLNHIPQSKNKLAMLFKNIYLRKWVAVEIDNTLLSFETDYFKKNKHWLIPIRYLVHWKFVECMKSVVLRNPVDEHGETIYRWPMKIVQFKSELLAVIDAFNKDFNMNPIITPKMIYKDMHACWMIRKNLVKDFVFEVRSMYKPNEAVSRDEFVNIWENCNV
eukprot:47366_1